MQDLFVEDEWVNQFTSMQPHMGRLLQIYIQAVYFEHWYSADADHFTIPSAFYQLEETDVDADLTWTEPKFVRLNSVSPKHRQPVYSMKEARHIINTSARCLESIRNAQRYGFTNLIVIRDWKDLNHGNEYRTFIYNDKLTAITDHDGHAPQSFADSDDLMQRVEALLSAARFCLPHTTVSMDVFPTKAKIASLNSAHTGPPPIQVLVPFIGLPIYGIWQMQMK